MHTRRSIKIYGNRGQGVLLVLYSVRELGGTQSKPEVLTFIQKRHLYEITRHDLPPYESKTEPKYHTLLCWARKDALENEWLLDHDQRDMWQLSRDGRNVLEGAITRFRRHELQVRECYLWTPEFKRMIDPEYAPSDKDRIRPEDCIERLLEGL